MRASQQRPPMAIAGEIRSEGPSQREAYGPTAYLSKSQFLQLTPEQRVAFVRSGARPQASVGQLLRILVMMGRPRTCVPGLFCYMLGLNYAAAPLSWRVALQAVLCFLGGFVANLGNTYTDLEEDSRNLPGRVYLLTRIGYRRFAAILACSYLAMLTSAACMGLPVLLLMALSLFIVHEYSFPPLQAKRRPLIGLLVFAQVVSFPFCVAAFASSDLSFARALTLSILPAQRYTLPPEVLHRCQSFWGTLLFVNAWFIAKGMYKNIPDFYGDRASSVRTSATVFRSWKRAASAATLVTAGAYMCMVPLAYGGLLPWRVLLSLLWLGPVLWNCRRLIHADGCELGNQCLKTDMIISSAFMASLLMLIAPCWPNVLALLCGALVIGTSDLLNIDSRRDTDYRRHKEVNYGQPERTR